MRIILSLLLILSTLAYTSFEPVMAQDFDFSFDDPLPLPPPPIDDPADLPSSTSAADSSSNVSLTLPASVSSSDSPNAPSLAVSSETPRPGKIIGGRVNIRSGPSTHYESVAVLTTGSPITVLSKHGEWLKIMFPADQLVSIHKNYVNADITGEIPDSGVIGIVNQNDAEVRAFYWDKSTVVGVVNKGDKVTIKQERGQWYRILPPPSARAYVFASYVKVDGSEPLPTDSSPAPSNPNLDLASGSTDPNTGVVKLSEKDKKALALKEQYFQRLKQQEAAVASAAANEANAIISAIDELESKLREIDQEAQSRLVYPVPTTSIGDTDWNTPDPIYGGFTGWIENIGRLGSAPASFRLLKGGEVRFYLRSLKYDLNNYIGRRVWVNGKVELVVGASANILNVDQIRILTEPILSEDSSRQKDVIDRSTDTEVYVYTDYQSNTVLPPQPSTPSGLPEHVGLDNETISVDTTYSGGLVTLDSIPTSISNSSPNPLVTSDYIEYSTVDSPLILEMQE